MSGLRYPGGKTRAVKILSKYIPDECKTVISPFLGGGSFEIYLAKSGRHVYGNDILKPLIDYWTFLIDAPDTLRAKIQTMHPITKDLFEKYQTKLKNNQTVDDLESAALFFILNRSSFSGTTMSGGFSKEAGSKRFTQSSIDRVKSQEWMSNMTVDCQDFQTSLQSIDMVNDDLIIFADPPYMTAKKLYGINGEGQNIDHTELRDTITQFRKWIITYDDSPEVRELYDGYTIIPMAWSYGMNSSKKSKEILIVSNEVLMDLWIEGKLELGELV